MNSHNQIVTCLIGDPVEHSVSDSMFNYFARLTGIEDYHHLKFDVSKNNSKNIGLAIKSISVLGMAGANITLPYKEVSIKYLDAVDKTVKLIGAVNTIVNKNGKLIGYNTDGYGAIEAIKTKLRPMKKSDNIVVFGAGGAARAIIGSLPQVNRVTILIRSSSFARAKKIKKDFITHGFEIKIELLADQNIISEVKRSNFVINATPVGMYPKNNTSLINKIHLDGIGVSVVKNIMFFDAVFNPYKTKFIRLAEQYGAKSCPGIYMMIYQGIRAFKLWTGRRISEDIADKTAKMLKNIIESKYEK